MKYVRISQDVWVNLEEIESITRNDDGTALLQGRQRIYASIFPVENLLMETREHDKEPPMIVQSPLMDKFETHPAW